MDAKNETDLSFEDALERLEALIAQMESGDIPLAALLDKFEEGNKLLVTCSARLKEAETKIERLKLTKNGPSFENFDPDKE